MKKLSLLLAVITIASASISGNAHFQTLIPSEDVVSDITAPFKLDMLFTHPMEWGPLMEMDAPKQMGVIFNGEKKDLIKELVSGKTDVKTRYKLEYKFNKPGDYVFYVEPAPYWEAAEGKYIIHYTKVVVDVLGAEEGWDAMVGFPVEVEPLTRPYSVYAGNVFQGIVRRDGKPVPFATVEVEPYNDTKKLKAPTEVHVTQLIKADGNGVFTYGIPSPGWWGFAALLDGPLMKSPEAKDVPSEIGGLIWINARNLK